MNSLILGTSEIRQLDGLYSLNDLHKAAGGATKTRPTFFMRLEQTQALIAEIGKCADSHISHKITRGSQGGTYVCKELVYAYANWISPAFYLKMIRAFDALHAPAALPAPEKVSRSLRQAINRKAHEITNRQYDTIHGIITDAVEDNLACGATEESAFGYVESYGERADGTVLVNLNDLRMISYEAQNVINEAARAVAAIRRIELRTGLKLAHRIPKSEYVDPDFHKHDRLVDEVIDRMTGVKP